MQGGRGGEEEDTDGRTGRLRRRLRAAAALAVAVVAALSPSTSLHASATVTGAIAFEGNVLLPTFPCANNPCTGGLFNGAAVAVAVVPDLPPPAVVLFPNVAMSASFSYSEACPPIPPLVPGVGPIPLSGSATGSFDIGPQADGDHLVGSFNWTRVGLAVVITTSGVTLTTPTGNHPASMGGAATAIFVPFPFASIGECPGGNPVTNQQAQVVGIGVSPL